MKLVFATHNENKCREARSIMPAGFELLTLNDIGCTAEIEENGATFTENAHLKCAYVNKHYGLDCFSDDSGLEVAALAGAPGIYSARYAAKADSKLSNMQLLLHNMQHMADRRAQFKTVICLIFEGKTYYFEGICAGEITHVERGAGGFGYDPVFIPKGYDKTFAELSPAEKNHISHRGKALNQLVDFLNKQEAR